MRGQAQDAQGRESHRKQGERHAMASPSEPSTGTNIDDTMILDAQPPTLWEHKFLLF